MKTITSVKNLAVRLNESGKIKIGEKGALVKSKNGAEFRQPSKFDYFKITTTEKGADENYLPDTVIMDEIKKNPAFLNEAGNIVKIPIRLLYDADDLNFPVKYVSYMNGKMSCYGDGEESFKAIKDNFETPCKCPCPRSAPGYKGTDKCKLSGALTCVIDGSEYFGQTHTFRTTGVNSVSGILGSLHLIKNITNGKVARLPLLLVLSAKNTITPDGFPTKVYVASIWVNGTLNNCRTEALSLVQEEKQFLISMDDIETTARKLSLDKLTIDEVEEKEFVEEFFPEARAKDTTIVVAQVVAPVVAQAEPAIDPAPEVEPIKETATESSVPLVESTECYLGEFPVAGYAKVYEAFLAEQDLEKAMAFAKRLRKENLQYWISTVYPDMDFSESAKKPELLELVESILASTLPVQAPETETEAPAQAPAPETENLETIKALILGSSDKIQAHPLLVHIAKATTRKEIADLVVKWFAPNPVDISQDTEDLVDMSIKRIEVLNGSAFLNTEKVEEVSEVKEVAEVEETGKATYVRDWDSSGPLVREQKIAIARIKKALEDSGKLSKDPAKWAVLVQYFLDKDGKAITSAKEMTQVQADTFMTMLKVNIVIPF